MSALIVTTKDRARDVSDLTMSHSPQVHPDREDSTGDCTRAHLRSREPMSITRRGPFRPKSGPTALEL